jgi:hypothetical protein
MGSGSEKIVSDPQHWRMVSPAHFSSYTGIIYRYGTDFLCNLYAEFQYMFHPLSLYCHFCLACPDSLDENDASGSTAQEWEKFQIQTQLTTSDVRMPFQKGVGERTDQPESAACPPHRLSHIPLTWHSGTEVVTSGL